MKRFLSLTAALILCSSFAIPPASSYGGGGMPPSVMLEREDVRIYAPARLNVKKAKRARPVKKKMQRMQKMQRRGERPSLEAGSAVETTSATIERFTFQPRVITVKVGTTVTWTNKDSVEHTVTGDAGGPDSPRLGKDESYSYTFVEPGTFPYHCTPHPYMQGVVEVTP